MIPPFYAAAARDGDDAQAVARHFARRRLHRFSVFVVGAHRQHGFGRAFDAGCDCSVFFRRRRPEAPLRLVADAVDDDRRRFDGAPFFRQIQKREIDRIAAPPIRAVGGAHRLRLAANRARRQKTLGCGGGEKIPLFVFGGGGENQSSALRAAREKANFGDAHFVLGQSAGFVAGDERASAEPFDRRQRAGDDAAPLHPPHGDGKRDRHRHRQPFRNRAHGQRDADNHHRRRRLAAPQKQSRNRAHKRDRADSQKPREASHLRGERRRRRLLRARPPDDGADFGFAPDRDDDSFAAPGARRRSGEKHIVALDQRRGGGDDARPLGDRSRFAAQRRFVRAQFARRQQAQIGGRFFAAFDPRQIARRDGLAIDDRPRAVALDRRLQSDERFERGCAFFCPALLRRADNGVHQQHDENKPGVDRLADGERNRARREQQINERAFELAQKNRA